MKLAAAGCPVAIQTQKQLLDDLRPEKQMENVLISLDQQYHLIRSFHETEDIFTYVVLNSRDANLAPACKKLAKIDRKLEIDDG